MSSPSSCLFITVGTTEFDQLIKVIDTEDFLIHAKKLGVSKLIVQFGRGSYEPKFLMGNSARFGISFSSYRFKDSLDVDMEEADVICSHCGAGSILEAVTKRKHLIVVVNTSLQDNHQIELADALREGAYAVPCEPMGVIPAMTEIFFKMSQNMNIDGEGIKEFAINDASNFKKLIQSMYSFY